MAWYITQSLLIVAATFVLGLIIGWLWWGRAWRRVPFGESAAVRVVRDRFQAALIESEAEITRLGQKLQTAELTVTTLQESAGTSETVGETGTTGESDGDDDESDRRAGSRRAGSGDPTGETDESLDAADTADTADADPDLTEAQPAEPAEPDDLQRIEGIGPRIATALIGAGLSTFHAIAHAHTEQLSAALREAGLSFAPSVVTWPLQARLLAAGEEETFTALKAELKAGRARPARAPQSEEPLASSENDTAVIGTIALGPRSGSLPVLRPTAGTDPGERAAAGRDPGTNANSDTGSGTGASVPAARSVTGMSVPTTGTTDIRNTDIRNTDNEDEGDELERVEGIGPRIATALRKAGIHTYRELASSDATALQAALAASGLRFTPSLPTWSRQAALLANGDEAGFLELARTLVPEREIGRPSS